MNTLLHTAVIDTPLGPARVAWGEAGMAALAVPGSRAAAAVADAGEPADSVPDHIALAVRQRLDGGAMPAIDLSGRTPFARAVLAAVASIPRGEVRTYAQVAAAAGHPGAARAVGSVLAGNPLPLLVPCHRVVPADGGIGGYSAGGPAAKAALLAAEGVARRA
jgi:methylated-DNA-[protein]-cysteine S-methyltransferase